MKGRGEPARYDPLAPAVRKDPYPFYEALRRNDPAFYVESLEAWAVSRYADVKEVARDHQAFSSDILIDVAFGPFNPAPGARYLIASDPPEHTRLRGLVQKVFTGQVVHSLEERIRQVANELIDEIAASTGPVDLAAAFAAPLPVTIIAELLGVERSMHARFRRWSNQVTVGADQTVTDEQLRVGIADAREFREYLDGAIAERRARPASDLISALVQAEERDSRLSSEEVLTFAVLLIIAGNETTTNTIGNTLMLLWQHPDTLRTVRANPASPSVTDKLVDESLRFWSPVQLLFRRATRDTIVAGQAIPAGAKVMPIFASANRDDGVYADADRFDVTRDARNHLAFGFGIHRCIGSMLGHQETVIALEELLRRAPNLEIVEDQVEWLDSFFLKGPKRLPARLHDVRPA